MNKADWNRAHMMGKLLYQVRTANTPMYHGEIERLDSLYDWFKRTGREEIIKEAERLCDERMKERGK